jgi:hypothetical protein
VLTMRPRATWILYRALRLAVSERSWSATASQTTA